MKASLVLLVLVISCAFALESATRRTIAQRSSGGRWTSEGAAAHNEPVSFKLEQIFWQVSDPSHVSYGQFLTSDNVNALIAPPLDHVQDVYDWVVSNGIPSASVTKFADYIRVSTSVGLASQLFQTSFSVFKSPRTASTRVRITDEASIPAEIADKIHFVSGISELFDGSSKYVPRKRPTSHESMAAAAVDGVVTPPVLRRYPCYNSNHFYSLIMRNYYDIPNELGSASNNLQGIAAFTDYYSLGAFQQFQTAFGLPTNVSVTRSGPNCLSGRSPCDQYESDLDIQYITAIGQGIPTTFINHADGQWILDWALELTNLANPPLVNSISYGWSELLQCEITSSCDTLGYTSQQYINRTDTQLQVLGVRGLSILVSDGDDGAASFYDGSGNCPIDTTKYCPVGGCSRTSTKCGGITFTRTKDNLKCFYPMGAANDACYDVLSDTKINTAFNAFVSANKACAVALDSDVQGDPLLYTTCACSALKSVTSSGYTVTGYSYDQNAGALFSADYPTSSPYVTSVGATQFTWNQNTPTSEVVCSIATGAIITTGGGFSSFQPQPSYQTAAVSQWVQKGSNLPPSYAYNPLHRGYPDIAFNGHNYQVYYSQDTNTNLDSCPCTSGGFDGTSCSSPAAAGVFSLINDKLLKAGKTPLGFLNPLLYSIAASNPNAFNDITTGDNKCNRAYCCQYGYTATAGWDPVGGLGSPVYSELLQAALALKGGN